MSPFVLFLALLASASSATAASKAKAATDLVGKRLEESRNSAVVVLVDPRGPELARDGIHTDIF